MKLQQKLRIINQIVENRRVSGKPENTDFLRAKYPEILGEMIKTAAEDCIPDIDIPQFLNECFKFFIWLKPLTTDDDMFHQINQRYLELRNQYSTDFTTCMLISMVSEAFLSNKTA